MIKFTTILWIGYFIIATACYPYLRNSYFPQFPSKVEKFVMIILACAWIISMPVTLIMKQSDNDAPVGITTSYDGFVGREQ